MIPTHVVSFNGRNETELQPRDGTVEDRLVQLLGRLNGTDRYSLILWNSTPHQYVIGRASGDADETESDEIVPWNGHETPVRPNEVLSGSEVSELFVAYYQTGEVPSSFTRRPIDV